MTKLDRRFWLLISDSIFSLVVLVAGWYLIPADLDKVVAVVGLLQPIAIALIVAYTAEVVADKHLAQARAECDSWKAKMAYSRNIEK